MKVGKIRELKSPLNTGLIDYGATFVLVISTIAKKRLSLGLK